MRVVAAAVIALLAGCNVQNNVVAPDAGGSPDAGPRICGPGDAGDYAYLRPTDGGCPDSMMTRAAFNELYGMSRCCERDDDCEYRRYKNKCVESECFIAVAKDSCSYWNDRYDDLETVGCSCGLISIVDCFGWPPPNVRCVSGRCQESDADAGSPGFLDGGLAPARCQ